MNMKEKKIFWIHFNIERSIGVNLKEILGVLQNFNKLFTKIAETKNFIDDKFKRETFEPFLVNKIREGSMAIGIKISPPPYSGTLFEDPYDETVKIVKQSLKKTEIVDDLEFFKSEFPKNQDRVNILSTLKNLNPWQDKIYKITYNTIDEPFEYAEFTTYLNREKRNLLIKWINEEKVLEVPYIIGKFNGFKASSDVFWIVDQKGKEVNCELLQDEIEKLNPQAGYIYKITGDYQEIPGSKPSMSNILNVEKIARFQTKRDVIDFYKSEIREIVNLNENWDGYGSKSFKSHTIKNTIFFLAKLIDNFEDECEKKLPRPMLFPGNNGSMNMEWGGAGFDLLITIPEDEISLAGLYGINSSKDEIQYDFNIFQVREELIKWLNKST